MDTFTTLKISIELIKSTVVFVDAGFESLTRFCKSNQSIFSSCCYLKRFYKKKISRRETRYFCHYRYETLDLDTVCEAVKNRTRNLLEKWSAII